MNINETTTMNANIIVKDANGADIVVAYLNASLDGGNQNFNINLNVQNKALLITNAEEVKTQYNEFETAVKSRAKDLGYVIFA
ncbi:MAG: hypothetical protein Q8936_06725 [Bacillota bacterium]|nr:hypothetical protein [Bacillota bacterium]